MTSPDYYIVSAWHNENGRGKIIPGRGFARPVDSKHFKPTGQPGIYITQEAVMTEGKIKVGTLISAQRCPPTAGYDTDSAQNIVIYVDSEDLEDLAPIGAGE